MVEVLLVKGLWTNDAGGRGVRLEQQHQQRDPEASGALKKDDREEKREVVASTQAKTLRSVTGGARSTRLDHASIARQTEIYGNVARAAAQPVCRELLQLE